MKTVEGFFPLQRGEKSLHTGEITFSIPNPAADSLGKSGKGLVQRNLFLLGVGFQLLLKATITRLGKRLNGTFTKGFFGIGNNEFRIQGNRISKTLTGRARTVRVVE